MARADGEGDHISGAEGEVAAADSWADEWTSEEDVDFASGDAEDLMRGGVEVVEGVDAVPPLWGPAVGGEGMLHGGGCLLGVGRREGAAIEEDREVEVVGNPAVWLEDEVLGRGRGGLGGGGGKA